MVKIVTIRISREIPTRDPVDGTKTLQVIGVPRGISRDLMGANSAKLNGLRADITRTLARAGVLGVGYGPAG